MRLAALACLILVCAGCATGPAVGWDVVSVYNVYSATQDAQLYFAANPNSVLEAIADAGATAFINFEDADVIDVDARSKLAVDTMETVAHEVFGIKKLSAYVCYELKSHVAYSESELLLGIMRAALIKQQGETK